MNIVPLKSGHPFKSNHPSPIRQGSPTLKIRKWLIHIITPPLTADFQMLSAYPMEKVSNFSFAFQQFPSYPPRLILSHFPYKFSVILFKQTNIFWYASQLSKVCQNSPKLTLSTKCFFDLKEDYCCYKVLILRCAMK